MSRDTEGDLVEVVNRTSKSLDYMFNGRQRVLKPGVNQIPAAHVEKARTQNVIMGTEDPLRPAIFDSYIACPTLIPDDDISPVEMPEKSKRRNERIDRSLLGPEAQAIQTVTDTRRRVERQDYRDSAGVGFTGSLAGEV